MVLFLNLLVLRTPRRHKPSSDSHSIYVPQAQQDSLQSVQHRAANYIQQYVRVDQSATTQLQVDKSKSSVAESHHVQDLYFKFLFVLFVFFEYVFIKPPTRNLDVFPSTADTQPCDGPPTRLFYFHARISV